MQLFIHLPEGVAQFALDGENGRLVSAYTNEEFAARPDEGNQRHVQVSPPTDAESAGALDRLRSWVQIAVER